MADATPSVLRDQLEQEEVRLAAQLARMSPGGDDLDFDEGFADSGQVTAERTEVEALSGSLQETLTEIRHALAKFDAGTFGRCESCDQRIAEARLEAKPAARRCITCASARR